MTFEWKGLEIKTDGDVMAAVRQIETREEADAFMRLWRKQSEYAYYNLGYLTGYMSREEGKRVRELFRCPHPFFGYDDLDPESAFAMGVGWGQRGLADLDLRYASTALAESLGSAEEGFIHELAMAIRHANQTLPRDHHVRRELAFIKTQLATIEESVNRYWIAKWKADREGRGQ